MADEMWAFLAGTLSVIVIERLSPIDMGEGRFIFQSLFCRYLNIPVEFGHILF
ncbi:hypothetical protein CCP3SC15_420020 [Gammaproteobacteria bacterium]